MTLARRGPERHPTGEVSLVDCPELEEAAITLDPEPRETLGEHEARRSGPAQARARYRDGLVTPTSGWAPGFTQANLVVLPREWAFDMLLFAQRNPQPVPLLDVTDPGSVTTPLAPDADLRSDLPRYRVWREGELVDEPTDVTDLWAEDLVAFLPNALRHHDRPA